MTIALGKIWLYSYKNTTSVFVGKYQKEALLNMAISALLATLTLGDILGTILGVASLGINVFGLMNNLRQLNTYRKLREKLEAVKILPKANKSVAKDEEKIFEWLNITDILSEPIRQKLLLRFVITAGLILAGSILVTRDFPGEVLVNYQAFENLDVLIVFLQVAIGLVGNSSFFLTSDEKTFLSNTAALHDLYYDSIILPAIQNYNKSFDQNEMFRRARDHWQDKIKHLSNDIDSMRRTARRNRRRE